MSAVTLKDAVREDLRRRMEQPNSDGEIESAALSPIATRPAPGSSCDEGEGEEEEDAFDELDELTSERDRVPPWTLTSQRVPPPDPQEKVPAPWDRAPPPERQDKVPPVQALVPPPDPQEKVPPVQALVPPPERQDKVPPVQALVPPPDPQDKVSPVEPREVSPGAPKARALGSTEFEASEPEESAPTPPDPQKKPAARVTPKKSEKKTKKEPSDKMKRPAAATSAKKRPAAAIDQEDGEGMQKKTQGSQSVLDSWPWVDVPDGPHLRECMVGEEWKAGLPYCFGFNTVVVFLDLSQFSFELLKPRCNFQSHGMFGFSHSLLSGERVCAEGWFAKR